MTRPGSPRAPPAVGVWEFCAFWSAADFAASKYGPGPFGSFGVTGLQPTSFGPRGSGDAPESGVESGITEKRSEHDCSELLSRLNESLAPRS